MRNSIVSALVAGLVLSSPVAAFARDQSVPAQHTGAEILTGSENHVAGTPSYSVSNGASVMGGFAEEHGATIGSVKQAPKSAVGVSLRRSAPAASQTRSGGGRAISTMGGAWDADDNEG